MAETFVKNRICVACGADVRDNAAFCYNCGGAVAAEIPGDNNGGKKSAGDNLLKENTAEVFENTHDFFQVKEAADEFNEKVLLEENAEMAVAKAETNAQTKLQSAAAMRKKPKVVKAKQIEIVWEEHENVPNVWFVLAAVILTLFAAGILYLALYLR